MAISASLVPGTSALSVLTDWRRSPPTCTSLPDAQERVPPVGGRSDATRRGQRRYRARHPSCHSEAKSHNSHSRMRFHCVIKSLHRIYAITHEEGETKSNYSSYKKMDLIHQPLNGMCDFTSEHSDVKSRTFRKMGRECGNADGM